MSNRKRARKAKASVECVSLGTFPPKVNNPQNKFRWIFRVEALTRAIDCNMSSPKNGVEHVLDRGDGGIRSVEGGKTNDKKLIDADVQRRPKRDAPGSRGKASAVGMVKSYGRQHGMSIEGVDSGVEKTENEGNDENDKSSSLSVTAAITSTTSANLYNANNLPKELWKQVEEYEAELRKNPKNVKALLAWGRLLVKVARNVIATHTSPESVKNVRLVKVIYHFASQFPIER
jgi:hypothetical protein